LSSSKPFPTNMCVTPIVVTITSGMGDNGAPATLGTWTGTCYLSAKEQTTFTSDGPVKTLQSFAIIPEDVCPEALVLEGSVTLFGDLTHPRKIRVGHRPRWPNGEVGYTKLELM